MMPIVASVQQVTDMLGEISAASEQRQAGIEGVNRAVAQMDEMTQQNSVLVEHAAAAAESLREQAEVLARTVGVFKIGTPPRALAPTGLRNMQALAIKAG